MRSSCRERGCCRGTILRFPCPARTVGHEYVGRYAQETYQQRRNPRAYTEGLSEGQKSNYMGYDHSRVSWDSYCFSTACGLLYIQSLRLTENPVIPSSNSLSHIPHTLLFPNELLQTVFQTILLFFSLAVSSSYTKSFSYHHP